MATVSVTDNNFETEVLKSSKPIVVDFWAEWCGPCKQIGPTLEEISDEMKDQVIIAKHNIDNEPNTPTKYGVRGIPTMLLFKDGELKSTKPTVVDFWAEWCGPCKQIGPALEEISDEMKDQVIIAKHNIDQEPNTPTKYGIKGIPTMLLFKGGELKATKVGATTKSNIVSWIKENI